VTCCVAGATGRVKCSIKKNASMCRAPKNGHACVGVTSSCCDACVAGSPQAPCVQACQGGVPGEQPDESMCGGFCPPGDRCLPTDSLKSTCACFPTGTTTCGETGFPTCGGECPGGDACSPIEVGFTQVPSVHFDICGCGPVGGSCQDQCGIGYECPGNQVCSAEAGPSPTCGCVDLP
jgi:hypothetical protein